MLTGNRMQSSIAANRKILLIQKPPAGSGNKDLIPNTHVNDAY
jgi:hypothetical protein